ncbi:MAG: hypothetical protein ACOY5B_16655 [Spirochaetota bacterium]
MGCPPDPVEVSIWRSSERIALLEERYHRFIDEYGDAALLAGQWGLSFVDLTASHTKEKFVHRTDVQASEYDQYADEHAQWQLESAYSRKVKELETALCDLRTRILCHLRERPVAADTGLIHRVQAAQACHREEDRQQAIAWLLRQCEILSYYTDGKAALKAQIDAAECVRRLALAREEIGRLQQLQAEELLYNRALTAIETERFEIPPRSR